MKKIKYLFILSLAFLLTEDAVEIVQVGRLTEDKAYLNVADGELVY
jgi:hypothetical protein